MKFEKLSEEQLSQLRDTNLTVIELASILNCGTATVCRWRKSLGVVVKTGSKKGKPRPWQIKQDIRTCVVCGKSFETIPSKKRRFCSISCSSKVMDRSYTQTEDFRNKHSKPCTPAYKKYAGKIHRLSHKIYEQYKQEINPNNYKRGLAGEDGAYHLDHIISIKYGFEHGIPPEEIAKKENLQMLPWKENINKGS